MPNVREYTFLSMFCGVGGITLGAQQAASRLFGHDARFRSVGGVDIDPAACRDFEYLTKSPALCTNIAEMTPADLRAFAGDMPPDVCADSSPCVGYSGLTNRAVAESPEYVAMNELYLTGLELVMSTWDIGPRLIVKENVPNVMSKGAHLVDRVTQILEAAGYAVHLSTHDCGELGGLAQHRRRALLVARQKQRVSCLLYQPEKKRVRGCGEVLGTLPLPETPSAGPMHRLPRIGWLTWVRLALIPAGGDHRDLPAALAKINAQRDGVVPQEGNPDAFWNKYRVEPWSEPAGAVTGATRPGSGAPCVSDPRVQTSGAFANNHAVTDWQDAAATVTTAAGPRQGAPSVADPRVTVGAQRFNNVYPVGAWGDPALAVTAGAHPSAGGPSVADPRVAPWFRGAHGVVAWDDPSGVITSGARPSSGPFSVADPRPVVVNRTEGRNPDHCYMVLPWTEASFTITGKPYVGAGAFSVADPRVAAFGAPLGCEQRADVYGVIPWTEAAKTILASGSVDNGAFAIADPRFPEVQPVAFISDAKRSPFILIEEPAKRLGGKPTVKRVNVPVVIIAEDGTWHRPMTSLERALLQGLPATVDGAPLQLDSEGGMGAIDARIGNMVPVGTARAIATEMLKTLLSHDVGAGMAPSGGLVWVDGPSAEALH